MGLFRRRGPTLGQLKQSALNTSHQAQAVLANADRTRADVEASALALMAEASNFLAFLAESLEEVQEQDIKLTVDMFGKKMPVTINIDLPGPEEEE